VVNRGERIPLHSPLGLDWMFIVGLFFRAMAHVSV